MVRTREWMVVVVGAAVAWLATIVGAIWLDVWSPRQYVILALAMTLTQVAVSVRRSVPMMQAFRQGVATGRRASDREPPPDSGQMRVIRGGR